MIKQQDYYEILQLFPGASPDQVRKSYRRLAFIYHPDKNPGDPAADEKFRRLQEAYAVIADPDLRYAYDRQHGYLHTEHNVLTPQYLLKEAERLKHYVYSLDMYRMNTDALQFQINRLLAPGYTRMIAGQPDRQLRKNFIDTMLPLSEFLRFDQMKEAFDKLEVIANHDSELTERIKRYKKESRDRDFWRRYTPLLVLLITIALCVLIYLLSDRQVQ